MSANRTKKPYSVRLILLPRFVTLLTRAYSDLLLALQAHGWELAGVTSDTALAAYLALRRSDPQAVHRRWWLLAGCVVEVAALTVMLIMVALELPWLGVPQAIMVLIASVWFAAVGFGVLGVPLEAKTEAAGGHEGGGDR